MKRKFITDTIFLISIIVLFFCSYTSNVSALSMATVQRVNNNANTEVGGSLLSLVTPGANVSNLFTPVQKTENLTPITTNTPISPAPAQVNPDPFASLTSLLNTVNKAKATVAAIKKV